MEEPVVLSQTMLKKKNKFKLLSERNRERRPEERTKRREKYKLERQNGAPSKDEVRKEQLIRLKNAIGTSLKVCVDLQYEHLMIEKELNHLANQVKRVYSNNKAAVKPVHLYLTSLDRTGLVYKTCCEKNDGFDNYILSQEERSVVDIFDPKSLIYLSPDADDVLTELEEDKVYVIGGLVDDSVKGQVTVDYSSCASIRCCRLPIPEYMERTGKGTYKQILTINQIFDILVKLYETGGDWRAALSVGVPPKTGFRVKPDLDSDPDPDDTSSSSSLSADLSALSLNSNFVPDK